MLLKFVERQTQKYQQQHRFHRNLSRVRSGLLLIGDLVEVGESNKHLPRKGAFFLAEAGRLLFSAKGLFLVSRRVLRLYRVWPRALGPGLEKLYTAAHPRLSCYCACLLLLLRRRCVHQIVCRSVAGVADRNDRPSARLTESTCREPPKPTTTRRLFQRLRPRSCNRRWGLMDPAGVVGDGSDRTCSEESAKHAYRSCPCDALTSGVHGNVQAWELRVCVC